MRVCTRLKQWHTNGGHSSVKTDSPAVCSVMSWHAKKMADTPNMNQTRDQKSTTITRIQVSLFFHGLSYTSDDTLTKGTHHTPNTLQSTLSQQSRHWHICGLLADNHYYKSEADGQDLLFFVFVTHVWTAGSWWLNLTLSYWSKTIWFLKCPDSQTTALDCIYRSVGVCNTVGCGVTTGIKAFL